MGKPLADRILVKPDEAASHTKGGIIVPDNAKERPARGTIIETGPGKHGEPMSVKIGDRIMYGKYAGIEIEENDQTFIIMRETDVFRIL